MTLRAGRAGVPLDRNGNFWFNKEKTAFRKKSGEPLSEKEEKLLPGNRPLFDCLKTP